MRRWRVDGLVLLALLPALLLAHQPASREAPTPWAMSSQESGQSAAIIATTKKDPTPKLPADSRLPLPDDGLINPARKTTTATARPAPSPGLLKPLPKPVSSNKVENAFYVPPPVPHIAIQPVGATTEESTRPTGSTLAVQVFGPLTALAGQTITYTLLVRNTANMPLGGVGIDLPIPSGVRILSAKPEAEREDGVLRWQLGNMQSGTEHRLDLEVQVNQAADLSLSPVARFTAILAMRTTIVRPAFALTVQCPEAAAVGEKVVLQVQVANNTRDTMRRINLRCELSPGLLHPQGQLIEAELPEDLGPGQLRTIPLETQAQHEGQHRATISATAEGNHTAQTLASVQVTEPALSLAVVGPRKAAVGQELSVQVEVANPARRTCALLRVLHNLPQGVEFASASHGGIYNPITQTITWDIASLPGEHKQVLTCKVRTRDVGDWAMSTSLVVNNTPKARATHAMQIEATPSLSFEMTAQDETVSVGRDTLYEIRVFNRGPGAARSVRLVLSVPETLSAVQADGPTKWEIRRQQVYFDALPEMPGRREAIYRVRVRGMKPGEGSVRAELHAAGLGPPMQQERASAVTGR